MSSLIRVDEARKQYGSGAADDAALRRAMRAGKRAQRRSDASPRAERENGALRLGAELCAHALTSTGF